MRSGMIANVSVGALFGREDFVPLDVRATQRELRSTVCNIQKYNINSC